MQVKYGELRSDNAYNNREVAFTAEVDEDNESVQTVLRVLKSMVEEEFETETFKREKLEELQRWINEHRDFITVWEAITKRTFNDIPF